MDGFITGDVIISGHTATFARTILLVTKETRCRMRWQGTSVINYSPNYQIETWRDYWDVEEMEKQWTNCQFPFSISSSTATGGEKEQPPTLEQKEIVG